MARVGHRSSAAGILGGGPGSDAADGLFSMAPGRSWLDQCHNAWGLECTLGPIHGRFFIRGYGVAIRDGTKLSLIVSMAIGGSVGSTAGGLKIIRLLVVIRLLSTIVRQA